LKQFLLQAGLALVLTVQPAESQPADKLSIQDAVRIALETNPDIVKAHKEIEAADGRILQAGRIPNPELGLAWNEAPSLLHLGDADERDIGISQAIEFPTKRSHRVGVASADKRIAELKVESMKRLVTSSVKRAYIALLFAQQVAANLQDQQKLLTDFQSLVTSRFESGQSTYLDVVRVKVEIARINNELLEALRGVRLKEAELNLLLGRGSERRILVTDSLAYVRLSARRDSLLLELSERSATLSIARYSLDRHEESLSLAQTSYLPDFSIGLFHQRRAGGPPFHLNNFNGTTSSSLGFHFGVSIPLWFWQEPKGLVQEASALRDIASVTLQQTERRVRAR
jgi:cobalt-zinc-cadmium efflux system outer membrane protein